MTKKAINYIEKFNLNDAETKYHSMFDELPTIMDLVGCEENAEIGGWSLENAEEICDLFGGEDVHVDVLSEETCNDNFAELYNDILEESTDVREFEDDAVIYCNHPILGNVLIVNFDVLGIVFEA